MQELETERAHLATRLTKVDEAIATMRELFHLPGVVTAARKVPKPRKAPATNGNGHHATPSVEAIRAALRKGPLSPGALAEQLGVSPYRLHNSVAKLEAQGVLVSSGATATRRIALAGSPAKEVP